MTFHSKRFLLGAAALAATIGVASTYVAAQNTNANQPPFRGHGMMGRGGPGMPGGPGGPLQLLLGRGAERLGLTDAQQSQIKSIAESHKTELQSLMKQVGDARHTLITAQLNAQSDDQIRQLWSRVADAESQMIVAETHVIAEAMQVLTPDQQAKVKQFASEAPRGRGRR
jgi:Spy/CpxP family protein refolding chaperone